MVAVAVGVMVAVVVGVMVAVGVAVGVEVAVVVMVGADPMIRYPRGYKPGIPTFSPDEEKKWMLYCALGKFEDWCVSHMDANYIKREEMTARARAMGMDDTEIRWHLSQM